MLAALLGAGHLEVTVPGIEGVQVDGSMVGDGIDAERINPATMDRAAQGPCFAHKNNIRPLSITVCSVKIVVLCCRRLRK